jgi:hypothetical protein
LLKVALNNISPLFYALYTVLLKWGFCYEYFFFIYLLVYVVISLFCIAGTLGLYYCVLPLWQYIPLNTRFVHLYFTMWYPKIYFWGRIVSPDLLQYIWYIFMYVYKFITVIILSILYGKGLNRQLWVKCQPSHITRQTALL